MRRHGTKKFHFLLLTKPNRTLLKSRARFRPLLSCMDLSVKLEAYLSRRQRKKHPIRDLLYYYDVAP